VLVGVVTALRFRVTHMLLHLLTSFSEKEYLDLSLSFLSLTSFSLLTVEAEGYCCTLSHSVTYTHSIGLLWTSDRPVAETSTCTTHNTHKRHTPISPGKTRTHNTSKRGAADPRLRPCSQSSLRRRYSDIMVYGFET